MPNWDTPEYYRFFAGEANKGGSPLYEALSLGMAEDDELQALAALRRPEQPPANILFASMHYLLLGGLEDAMADYCPSVGGARPVDAAVVETFRAFCLRHRDSLEPLIRRGVTNTNEVGRSAFLAPAFSVVARETGKPLALIELGPSAGLNLNFDRYGYRYLDGSDPAPRVQRWTNSSLVLTCALRQGEPPLPAQPPAVASRVGLELAPSDASVEHDRRWLRALVWPEREDRLAKLDAALAIAHEHPPPIRAGDALELLPAALAQAPRDAEICIYHSMVTYQFSREMKQRLDRILSEHASRRGLWRVAVEWEKDDGKYPVRLTRLSARSSEQRVLAHTDPHGLWLRWYGG